VTGLQNNRADANIETATAPRDKTWLIEFPPKPAQRYLKAGGSFVILDQKIRDSQRMQIERASRGNTKSPKAYPPKILHHCGETGVPNG